MDFEGRRFVAMPYHRGASKETEGANRDVDGKGSSGEGIYHELVS
jgi:hypothetical protein